MNKFEVAKKSIKLAVGRGGLITKKYSPEILMTLGVVGIVTSTVLACRATLKVDEVLDESKDKFDRIKEAHEMSVSGHEDYRKVYSEQDYQKDMTIAYVQTGFGFVKLYGPAVTLGVASIACILGAHGIMKKRNVALVAAYKGLEEAFKDYRKRVAAEFGEEKEYQIRNGIHEETITETEVGPDGKEKKVKKKIEVANSDEHSIYAKYFDSSSHEWDPVPEYNLVFLKAKQNYLNDMLHSRGHVFLNEAYDELGIPRTQAGAVVGWVMSKDGSTDNFIDFGIHDVLAQGYSDDHHCDTISEERRDFVNGYRNSILLDFNVDGVIYDLI